MIRNDQELQCTQERIAFFCRNLDGSLTGCVQWSPRQAQRGLLLRELC